MTKFAALIMLTILRVSFSPTHAQTDLEAFGITSLQSTILHAKVMSFSGSVSNDKVFLQWIVNDNASADQFEIEKSMDGKNFKMAALVFATESPSTDNYFFYEKSTQKIFHYRIKLINKDGHTEYSSIIQVRPKS